MGSSREVHEDYSRHETVRPGSDRAFGFTMAVAGLVFGGLSAWKAGGFTATAAVLWALALGFGSVALVAPSRLAPLNRAWLKLGLLINRIVGPLATGIVFFLVVTPIGLMLRLAGKDPLRLKRDPGAASYWIPREPPGPEPKSMTHQF